MPRPSPAKKEPKQNGQQQAHHTPNRIDIKATLKQKLAPALLAVAGAIAPAASVLGVATALTLTGCTTVVESDAWITSKVQPPNGDIEFKDSSYVSGDLRTLLDDLNKQGRKPVVLLVHANIAASGRGADTSEGRTQFRVGSITSQETDGDYTKEEDYRKNFYKAFEQELRRAGFNVRNSLAKGTRDALADAQLAGADLIFDAEFYPKFSKARFYVDSNGRSHAVQEFDLTSLTTIWGRLDLSVTRVKDNSKSASFTFNYAVKDGPDGTSYKFYSTKKPIEFVPVIYGNDTAAQKRAAKRGLTYRATGFRFAEGARPRSRLVWPAPAHEDAAKYFATLLEDEFRKAAGRGNR